MDRAILTQRMTSILADQNRQTNALYAMNTTDIQRYPDDCEALSIDAALRAGKGADNGGCDRGQPRHTHPSISPKTRSLSAASKRRRR